MKRKAIELPTVYKFWKGNVKSAEFTLGIEDLKAKYLDWLKTKEISWITYYEHATVAFFISDQTGLNSVCERDWLWAIEEQLMEVRHKLYPVA